MNPETFKATQEVVTDHCIRLLGGLALTKVTKGREIKADLKKNYTDSDMDDSESRMDDSESHMDDSDSGRNFLKLLHGETDKLIEYVGPSN